MMECTIKISGKQYALEYLAEGAANIVYKLEPSYPDLLRLRKTRSSVSYSEIVHSFETVVAPLFPSGALLHPKLFKLLDAEVLILRLNQELRNREVDGGRSEMRKGTYLTTREEYGIFVQDMTPQHRKEKFVEFKPKWLIQSPNAPTKAKRCRTCALKELRRAGNVFPGRGDADFCPLDLLSSEDGVLEDVLKALVAEDLSRMKEIFKAKVQPLLVWLRTLQAKNNQIGLADMDSKHISAPSYTKMDRREESSAGPLLSETLVGMTLRDCSVFIKYTVGDSETEAEVKLADLDIKSAKFEKWANTERQLIDGGWYRGTEEVSDERGRRFCRALRES